MNEDIRADDDRRNPEVLFPRFTSQTPWGEEANFYNQPPVLIPISRLCHITHEFEAGGIEGDTQFTFIPTKKLGKQFSWDGSPLGTTYRKISDNKYKEIRHSEDNPVFPGYLSWWGINTQEENIMDQVRANKDNGRYPPAYLSNPPGSHYGNKAFSTKLEHILLDYQRSRDDRPNEEAYLRGAGTLRYRHEICYVIMVCMQGDNVQDTFALPQNDPNGIINLKGMVDEQGVVINYSEIPIFQPKSIVKYEQVNRNYKCYDWENLAFCFYFPSRDQNLICNKMTCSKEDIAHNPPKCTATRPDPDNLRTKWKCPNELGMPKKL